METDQFDALTARLAQALSRRRSLGLLAALGAAASLAGDDAAGKKKRKKKKKKPCGGACGACQACVGGVCTLVADGASCGSGTCFAGQCLTCPSGKVAVAGRCAKRCTQTEDCGAGQNCYLLVAEFETRYCVVSEPFDSAPDCPTGASSECGVGRLCVSYALAPKCLVAA